MREKERETASFRVLLTKKKKKRENPASSSLQSSPYNQSTITNSNKEMLKLLTRIRLRRRRNFRFDFRCRNHRYPNPNGAADQDGGERRGVPAPSSAGATGNVYRADHYDCFEVSEAVARTATSSSSSSTTEDSCCACISGGDHDNDDVSSRGRVVVLEGDEPASALSSGESKVDSTDKDGLAVPAAEKNRMELPPDDDCCPICFGNFAVPCRGPCGHWYCGGCILQYWNYTAALQACNCPMCSQKITKLTPEASLFQQQDEVVIEVLRNVRKYNRLFVGGAYGMILKVFELPLYIKRMFSEMMNPDRPGAHLNKLRMFAMTLGFLYSISPFDFLRIGRHNVVDVFDYSAIVISLILYGVGIYLQRQRFRHVRELAAVQL